MCLFGFEVREFASIDRAIFTTFRVMEGEVDFDWGEMESVGRWQTALWFTTFTVIVVMLMLNMLLSIVMDTYMEVKGRLGAAETLWSQATESWRRHKQWRAGKRMSIPEINKALKESLVELDQDPGARARGQCGSRVITVDGFRALVPDLGDAQARRLLTQAIVSKEDQEQAAVSMCDTFKLVKKIDGSVSNLSNSLRFLDKVNTWTADKMQEIQTDVQKGKRTSEDLLNKLVLQQTDMGNQLLELQRQQVAVSKLVAGLQKDKGMKRNTGAFQSDARIVGTQPQSQAQTNETEVGGCSTGVVGGVLSAFFDGN
jgi:hypothetical protein